MARVDVKIDGHVGSFQNNSGRLVCASRESIEKKTLTPTDIARIDLYVEGALVYVETADPISVRPLKGTIPHDVSSSVITGKGVLNRRVLEMERGTKVAVNTTVVACR